MVADSSLAGRFVRQALDGSIADCDGRARPATRSDDRSPAPVVELAPAADPRDALDRNEADLVVSRDARVEQYARKLTGVRVIPLPWDLTYVLVAPRRGDPPSDGDRTALATDAVTALARGAEPPFWWAASGACAARPGHPPTSTIRFSTRDPIARGLAERLVALLSLPSPPAWLTAAVGETSRTGFRAVPVAGSLPLSTVVVPYPRAAPPICDSTRWSVTAIPLIDSRAFLVVRSGVPAFEILGDGSIHFVPPSSR
jgi:hypothetical protein